MDVIPQLRPDYYFAADNYPRDWEELFAGGAVYKALERIGEFLAARIQRKQVKGRVHPLAVIGREVVIGEGTVVEAGAVIEGPCLIGSNVEIRHGAYLRKNCLIGDGSVVGHATEIKNSILLPGSAAPHFNYVGDSILGTGVNLGAGVKLANLRNDKAAVRVLIEGQRIDTGMKKLGAIIGDGTKLGCNVVTNPGCFLGRGCQVFPLSLISGFHPHETIFTGRRRK